MLLIRARFATAKADAGQWFELAAITGVVLGGTSITGGRGSIWGTLLAILGAVPFGTHAPILAVARGHCPRYHAQ